jgi:hypothetical protein
MEELECKNRCEMSLTDTIFGRWEFAVASVYIINGSGIIIGARLATYQY